MDYLLAHRGDDMWVAWGFLDAWSGYLKNDNGLRETWWS